MLDFPPSNSLALGPKTIQCAKHKIYTILDMHTVPGGQNADWHSDNPSTHAAFWDYKDHQDRTIWLWSEIAKRYKTTGWIAGYNPINEPCDPQHLRLPAFYARFEKEIRKIDAEHILWLDGNTFAMEWKGFESLVSGPSKLPNCAYSLHDYSSMGFPLGPQYTGTEEQKERLERQFRRKEEFMAKYDVPAWNGEFGPVYENPAYTADADLVNSQRYNLLGEQLRIYDKYEISWSIWLYKDIGVQGMVYTDPKSKWNETISPFLKKKAWSQIDTWGTLPSQVVDEAVDPFVDLIYKISPNADDEYPT